MIPHELRGSWQGYLDLLVAAFVVAAGLSLAASCSRDESDEPGAGGDGDAAATRAPVVAADGGGPLVFTWVDEEGEYHIASSRSEIPEDRRALVRVQDPSVPPGDPGTVWVADLREPRGGRFPVRPMKREQFDRSPRPRPAPAKAPGSAPSKRGPASGEAAATTVVMYSTSTCPVCRQARRWMTEQGISFVERDIGRDQAAAQQLQQKAQQQGVSARGVPVFEIKGRLIPGFDRQAIKGALGS